MSCCAIRDPFDSPPAPGDCGNIQVVHQFWLRGVNMPWFDPASCVIFFRQANERHNRELERSLLTSPCFFLASL